MVQVIQFCERIKRLNIVWQESIKKYGKRVLYQLSKEQHHFFFQLDKQNKRIPQASSLYQCVCVDIGFKYFVSCMSCYFFFFFDMFILYYARQTKIPSSNERDDEITKQNMCNTQKVSKWYSMCFLIFYCLSWGPIIQQTLVVDLLLYVFSLSLYPFHFCNL